MMINEERRFGPVTVRSRFMLEVASELAAMPEWPHKQVQLSMRDQVGGDWAITLLASDSPAGLPRVINGEAQVAILNPSVVLTLASRGTGPFKEPADLRAITVIHSYDQLAFAVAASTGVNSLAEMRDRRMPLRVSLRGQADHSVHMVVDEVLAAYGFSLDDMVSWGAQLEHHPGVNDILGKVDKVERGELDAIFDEGIMAWADKAFGVGMSFLPLEEDILQKLEGIGFRRGTIESRLYDGLPEDLPALDFSGFTVYTRADVPDQAIRSICQALEVRKDRIPRDSGPGPLPLHEMCKDTPGGPLTIPLHPAAEQFWRERGYL